MDFLQKVKTDALEVWHSIEGKLSMVKSPATRLAIVAGTVLILVMILGNLIPQILAILILIGVVMFLFKMFHTEEDKDGQP